MKKRTEHEYNEQVKFFNFIRFNLQYNKHREILHALNLCYSVPNGAAMPKQYDKKTKKSYSVVAMKMVKSGMSKGIPDINVDYPVGSYHSLKIEMKWGKNVLSPFQAEKRGLIEAAGSKYIVCYSAKEAIQGLVDYLKFPGNCYQGLNEFLA